MNPQALPLLLRIQVLLNTLIAERHVRRPLLEEVEELMACSSETPETAHRATLELLRALDEDQDVVDFDESIERISRSISLAYASLSSSVLASAGDRLVGT